MSLKKEKYIKLTKAVRQKIKSVKCKTYHDMRSFNSLNQLIITTAKDQI